MAAKVTFGANYRHPVPACFGQLTSVDSSIYWESQIHPKLEKRKNGEKSKWRFVTLIREKFQNVCAMEQELAKIFCGGFGVECEADATEVKGKRKGKGTGKHTPDQRSVADQRSDGRSTIGQSTNR